MRRAEFTVTPIIDVDGVASAQSLSAASDITLNGALIVGGKWASAEHSGQKLVITSVGVDSGITFTAYGKDAERHTVTASSVGGSASAVTLSTYFSEITRIAASGATAATITAGFSGAASTPAFIPNFRSENFTAALAEIVTGTINGTCQHTFDDVFSTAWTAVNGTWFPHDDTDMVGFSANQNSNYAFPPTACRTIINSASSASAVTFVVIVPD